MDTNKHRLNSRNLFLWIAIIIAACLVYITGISHESIWYDEAYSAVMAEYSPGEIIGFTAYDNHPPLYYILLSLVVSVFGSSEWALRALSVMGAVALVSLAAGPVRRIFGNKTALIYATLVLFTPAILTYAHEARTYTLSIFSVTAGVLYGYLTVQHNRTGDWVCFGLATLAAAYLHYYGLIAAFFTHLFVLLWIVLRKRELLKAYLITGAGVVIVYLPWLIVFIRQTMDVDQGFWLGPVSVMGVIMAFYQPFAYKEFYPRLLPTMSVVLLLSLALIVFGIISAERKEAEPERTFNRLVLCAYLGTLVTAIVASIVLAPIFYSRYMLVCLGLFLLLLSVGISLLPGKVLPPVAAGIFALLNVFVLRDIYTQYFNYPMKTVAQYVSDEIQPGDLIVTSDSYSMGPALYYFPEAVHYYSNNSIESQWGHVLEPLSPYLHDDEDREELFSTYDSFWYITCNTGLSKNIATILDNQPGWEESFDSRTFSEPYSFVQFTVSNYTYTGEEPATPRGVLNVHITGLKPVGHLIIILYEGDPISPWGPIHQFETINVPGEELSYSFHDLDYGDYVLLLAHDENLNNTYDIDPATQVGTEGMFVLNYDKLDTSSGMPELTFDELKFTFDQPEMNIEAEMMYPPFPGQSSE